MKIRMILYSFGLLSVVLTLSFATVTQDRQGIERYQSDPIAVRSLHPTFDMFPDSSLIDFSYLLDPPAGKFGPVYVGKDGHFYFRNSNKRVRFWGVTIAASHVDIPKERIKQVVEVIARAGCNLIRLHELDNRGGEQYNLVRRNIIDEAYPNNNNSRHFDKEYRDRVDYWIHCAKQKGIYVYLVVRGYRTFRSGDGLENADKLGRAAKPYAFFNRRLIELQKEYAEEWLINHINPYTGLANGKDPAVALIELENEDSLLFNPGGWNEMVEPYRTEFITLWNDYLIKKYKTTEALKKAWTNAKGECSLQPNESLEKRNIGLPSMPMRSLDELRKASDADPKTSPLRCNDGVRFAVELQRKYFAELRDFLRAKGCDKPFTAVVNSQITPDTYSVAQELDFIGENAYLDHPSFTPGKEWVGLSSFSNKNYIKESGRWSLAPYIAQYKWANKPLVVREWATCWPNRYRVSSIFDIAAYASMQDYDGLIYFSYYTWGDPDHISPFGLQADPTQWGLFGYGAKLFTQGEVKAAEQILEVQYTDADLYTWGSYMNDVYTLAWTNRMQNAVTPPVKQFNVTPLPTQRATLLNSAENNSKGISADSTVSPVVKQLKSTTGELFRNTEKGYATINTPMFQCVQGELEKYNEYALDNLKVISASTVASVVVTSLDKKSLSESDHYVLKMATIALNRGENLVPVTSGEAIGKNVLMNGGSAPVQTWGKPVEKPTQIFLNGKPLLDVYLENGTWELEVDLIKNEYRFFCDTPNTKITLYPIQEQKSQWVMQKYYYEFPPDAPVPIDSTFIYPGFAKYIRIQAKP
ncbi:MAG: hypothetical protein N3A72_12280 [bacterium]|nr:hypothetical protein [bacterium]